MQSIDTIETYAYGTSKDLMFKKEKNKLNTVTKQYKNVYLWLYYKRRHRIMATMCPVSYHHNCCVATHALGHTWAHYVLKCMSCHKAIVVITRRAYCFHDCIYGQKKPWFCYILSCYLVFWHGSCSKLSYFKLSWSSLYLRNFAPLMWTACEGPAFYILHNNFPRKFIEVLLREPNCRTKVAVH